MGVLAVGADVVWAPVIAALGASILTIAGLPGRDAWADRRQSEAHRLAAYEALLVQSMAVAQVAAALDPPTRRASGHYVGSGPTRHLVVPEGNESPLCPDSPDHDVPRL